MPTQDSSAATIAGYQQITLGAGATALTVPSSPLARFAIIQAEAQSVRWRDDGTDPTAAIGMLMAAGDSFVYNGDLKAIKFIRVSAGAILNVSYYR